jgi:hypothetical protein
VRGGDPACIPSDNGPEFMARKVPERLRDELLAEQFDTLPYSTAA